MKNKVKYSVYSIIVSVLVIGLFIVGLFAVCDDPDKLIVFSIIIAGTAIFSLYYCPLSTEADDSAIRLNRLMSKPKTFAYSDIRSVDTCYPSAGSLKLCGSGGFLGYWGYFNDIMIGTYFGYYGSRSYCILVTLKNGRQYVLGCQNPVEMVDYIKTQMEKKSGNKKY